MLVDSSVWIAFLRGAQVDEVQMLKGALATGGGVWLAPPILQKILQGAERADRLSKLDRELGELPLLEAPDQRAMARAAALLYARCRWSGFTPRSSVDCLIASYAIAHEMPMLQLDRDFPQIARVEPRLRLISPPKHKPTGA